MDQVQKSDFLTHLSGRVFLNQFEAIRLLDEDCANRANGNPKVAAHTTDWNNLPYSI